MKKRALLGVPILWVGEWQGRFWGLSEGCWWPRVAQTVGQLVTNRWCSKRKQDLWPNVLAKTRGLDKVWASVYERKGRGLEHSIGAQTFREMCGRSVGEAAETKSRDVVLDTAWGFRLHVNKLKVCKSMWRRVGVWKVCLVRGCI